MKLSHCKLLRKQQLKLLEYFVLNVGATAAGVDSEGNQQACEGDPETLAKDKEFVLMLNYGLNLPKGVNTSCDKATL
jgi:hypothetical protein